MNLEGYDWVGIVPMTEQAATDPEQLFSAQQHAYLQAERADVTIDPRTWEIVWTEYAEKTLRFQGMTR